MQLVTLMDDEDKSFFSTSDASHQFCINRKVPMKALVQITHLYLN